ncbi:uncharacterized protein LOC132743693 [Ruditapes philippinarum]|uniref:uncharacterized protein LOC132743693 n=1 Tax=Ruditapes philippinarum TaxID=129788 RepID=UPI00295AB2E5|nr:uncharacterized protein LOC132743693 [Ruditapes philippinarum]
MAVLQLLVDIWLFLFLNQDVGAVFPGFKVNKLRYALVTYYFRLGYTWKEICGFICCAHNIMITLRQIRRIVQRLGLRRYGLYSPLPRAINEVRQLCHCGFSNSGYRTIWRVLQSSGKVAATQDTVRQIVKVMDPAGVNLRLRRRLRRRIYVNGGPNFIIHIDGYDKLKPFGISIHGATDGYSRNVLWLRAAYTNNDLKIIARYYIEYIKTINQLQMVVRADYGTENSVVRDL